LGTPWTDAECQLAARLLRTTTNRIGRLHHVYDLIMDATGRSKDSVRNRLREYGPTFQGEPTARRAWRKRLPNTPNPYVMARLSIPQHVLDERERRRELEHTSVTAAFCGDPLPGYSALDRRGKT
jgi:hypothetical protein